MKAPLLPTLLCVAFAPGCGGVAPGPGARPPHVVLVVLDSVRADHVGALGYPRPTTPRLDSLARQGILYERAYAASSFGPQAVSALWTGRLPSQGGSTGTEAAPHPSLVTLPRRFRRAGYHTALASNSAELRARAFTRGFDALELDSVPGRWSGEKVTQEALDLADGRGDAPLFLVVDYTDAGPPHLPAPEERGRFDVPAPPRLLSLDELRARAGDLPADMRQTPEFLDLVARYDAEVATVDRFLGELVDGLDARGMLADTVLVITSSHGVEFLEHGYVGSGWTLEEEVLRVPLAVLAPGRTQPARITEPVSLVDLLPSLLAVAGGDPPDQELAGRALFARSGARILPRASDRPVLAELVLPGLAVLRAAIRGGEELLECVQWTEPAERLAALAGRAELQARIQRGEAQGVDPLGAPARRVRVDLATGEAADVPAGEEPVLAALLARYVELCRATAPAPVTAAPPPEEEPAALDELRQIGYL